MAFFFREKISRKAWISSLNLALELLRALLLFLRVLMHLSRTNNNLLQSTCGKRAETFESRRKRLEPKNSACAEKLRETPPSSFACSTSVFWQTRCSEPLGFFSGILFNGYPFVTHCSELENNRDSLLPLPHIPRTSGQSSTTRKVLPQRSVVHSDQAPGPAGQLRNFVQVWEEKGAPATLLKIIRGYAIPFSMKPPLVPLSSLLTSRCLFIRAQTSWKLKEKLRFLWFNRLFL